MARTDIVQCQKCHGDGGHKEVVLDDGSGPWEDCGYCNGTGKTTKMMNAWIMRWSQIGGYLWCPSKADDLLHDHAMAAAATPPGAGAG